MLRSHAEFLHHGVAGGADAEAVNADDFAFETNVFPPEAGDAGFAWRTGWIEDSGRK